MVENLPDDLASRYRSSGYYFPVNILSPQEAQAYRARLEADEAAQGERFLKEFRHKPHLVANWAWELVNHPLILDAVEAVLGPDLLCWESALFMKNANSPEYISWHQDITYWGLDSDSVATAWLALSPSTVESGCMRVVPGSHTAEVAPHRDTYQKENLLSRGQEIEVDVDEAEAVDLVLEPGQASLHHVKIIHGSNPNRSADRRIGFAIRYITPSVGQVVGEGDSATLVRGEDRFGHFELEKRPHNDYAADVIAYHAVLRQRRYDILMRP